MTVDFDKSRDIILFYTPEALVHPHLIGQAILAATLQERGYKVLMAYCPGIFPRCPAMDANNHPFDATPDQREKLCQSCQAVARAVLSSYGLKSVDLGRVTEPEMQHAIHNFVTAAPPDLENLEYNGLKIGKIAVRDLVPMTKHSDFNNVDESVREKWKQYIESILYSYFSMKRLLHSLPIKHVLHFNEYATSNGAIFALREAGILTTAVTFASHRGTNRQKYILLDEPLFTAFGRLSHYWKDWQDTPLTATAIKELSDDLVTRMSANSPHIYSPPKTFQALSGDLYEKLGLSKDKKLLVAFTSSLDEARSAEMLKEAFGVPHSDYRQPFANQIEWLTALTELVAARDDRELVVRIHPREGTNKRESLSSQHLVQLKAAFDRPLKNCRFIWPEDKTSSYDLMEIADLALTSWSTIGVEMARLGVPVLTAYQEISYPPNEGLIFGGETREAYFEKLEHLLCRPPSIVPILAASRLAYLAQGLAFSIDLSDVVPTPTFNELPQFRLPSEAATIEDIVVRRHRTFQLNRQRFKYDQTANGTDEQALMKRELRRAVHFFFTGQDIGDVGPITRVDAAADDSDDRVIELVKAKQTVGNQQPVIIVRGRESHYWIGSNFYSRYSPMLNRLAMLCAES